MPAEERTNTNDTAYRFDEVVSELLEEGGVARVMMISIRLPLRTLRADFRTPTMGISTPLASACEVIRNLNARGAGFVEVPIALNDHPETVDLLCSIFGLTGGISRRFLVGDALSELIKCVTSTKAELSTYESRAEFLFQVRPAIELHPEAEFTVEVA
ncbi:hypothetical protein GCM10017608_25650 [Agromyces luteolus]|uniref:Uncharacterized protein n=1 Tax=Agromyces luteolus TaxID=88373 RepID=A0A7C9HNU1_9MICO|nr:hypothetical protein [Agromyces luteolus]MUN08944.1 hypothetical protein [Agromyces luteolus]GLK28630.1 hypothetical protein GCM10017608_25650 [Agromyces luteolus]